MSRRESAIKTIAVSLQPKGFEIPYRKTSGRSVRVKPELAAGALAFTSMDREVEGETIRGDTFNPLLLRLKYAEQDNRRALFIAALERMLERHGGLVKRGGRRLKSPSETMYATAFVALFEWLNDACPKCRELGSRVVQPDACPACRPTRPHKDSPLARRETLIFDREGRRVERIAARLGPAAGCPTCRGLDRVFTKHEVGKGMVCHSCRNSGRKHFSAKQRWRLISDHLAQTARARGITPQGFAYDGFSSHWHGKYQRFLDALRAADKAIADGVDMRFESRARTQPLDFEEIEEPNP